MKVFIVAIPLFDSEMAVSAYRLCDQDGEKILGIGKDFRRMNEALASPGLDLVNEVGVEPFTNGKPLFVDINPLQLMIGAPTDMRIEPQKLVCVLPEDISGDADILQKCGMLKRQGYQIAFNSFPTAGLNHPILRYIDYIIMDSQDPSFSTWRTELNTYSTVNDFARHIKVVMSNIPDMPTYQQLARSRTALFTGQFYSQPLTKGESVLSPVKINALHLLNQVNQEDFDLMDIVRIIERDPFLSISLLRFINSGEANIGRQIESIKSAVAILGQKDVRRWATVAISINLMDDRPSEITKLSLVRAKYAENLAPIFDLGAFQPALFMTGLFSLLDVILEKPMADAINEVAVNEKVKQALVDEAGDFYTVMEFIYAYEHADWDKCNIIMIQNKVNIEKVNEAFIGALVYYNKLLEAIAFSKGED